MAKSIFKNDQYKRVRGGYSRLLDVCCAKCNTHVCYYQKDGSGILKRMYLDRMFGFVGTKTGVPKSVKATPSLVCKSCRQVMGVPMNYVKEGRLAYRLFVGSIAKKIAKSSQVKI